MTRPSTQDVWDWLATIPDPEIPVVTIVDLGIVRDVEFDGGTCVVAVTPTYSGCPATTMIDRDIKARLESCGLDDVRLEHRLSPAWTTDWMSAKARAALEAYGIAPPRPAGGPERCPHCHSQSLEKLSQFGSTPCKAQWRCRDCLEPFEYFKCI